MEQAVTFALGSLHDQGEAFGSREKVIVEFG